MEQRKRKTFQVKEGKINELNTHIYNNEHSSINSHSFSILNNQKQEYNLSNLDDIIRLSQKNLQILSIKLGRLPKHFLKALDITKIAPETLNIQEKLECLIGIENLRGKLIDYSLDCNEILGYFKDILLELESNAIYIEEDKEKLMKFVDKRVDIFQSGDTTRTKLQESYHLIMNLENFTAKKNKNFNDRNDTI